MNPTLQKGLLIAALALFITLLAIWISSKYTSTKFVRQFCNIFRLSPRYTWFTSTYTQESLTNAYDLYILLQHQPRHTKAVTAFVNDAQLLSKMDVPHSHLYPSPGVMFTQYLREQNKSLATNLPALESLSISLDLAFSFELFKHSSLKLAHTPFETGKVSHETQLQSFWDLATYSLERKNGRFTDEWEVVGFQGKDPKTDFRGTGMFGMEMLLKYATFNSDEVRAMVALSGGNPEKKFGFYSFALIGINITSHLLEQLKSAESALSAFLFFYVSYSMPVQKTISTKRGTFYTSPLSHLQTASLFAEYIKTSTEAPQTAQTNAPSFVQCAPLFKPPSEADHPSAFKQTSPFRPIPVGVLPQLTTVDAQRQKPLNPRRLPQACDFNDNLFMPGTVFVESLEIAFLNVYRWVFLSLVKSWVSSHIEDPMQFGLFMNNFLKKQLTSFLKKNISSFFPPSFPPDDNTLFGFTDLADWIIKAARTDAPSNPTTQHILRQVQTPAESAKTREMSKGELIQAATTGFWAAHQANHS
ncbi:putative ELMO domain-containing protein [Blattamonas nauphoetae]|uniref:ELMO domain-containing protein n=1 Tax=Blattamonas nauphoetae TaxID=2049346 RepID=A0ABQ9Y1V3_9EUKA|nr:putative ELMO domain-containing protein [Blattamonas nauphoetae]